MSPAEALWFAKVLDNENVVKLSPMLNLGSSTKEYRTVTCPHIERDLFGPLVARGVKVFHSDLKVGPGIDIAADILDPDARREIGALGIQSVLCNNLLEHVEDIDLMYSAISEICPQGGLLCLSVPHEYPYHPDPIDNGYRPTILDLERRLAPMGFRLITGEIVDFGSYADSLRSKRWLLLRDIYMLFAGIVNKQKWRVLFENYRYVNKRYKVACSVFVRDGQKPV